MTAPFSESGEYEINLLHAVDSKQTHDKDETYRNYRRRMVMPLKSVQADREGRILLDGTVPCLLS